MDPLAPIPLPSILQSLRLEGVPEVRAATLLAQWVGHEVDLLLLLNTPDRIVLRTPTGQRIEAQGTLPFPEGTQLRAEVQAAPEGLRLRTLAAQPPDIPPLLAPLFQGEAQALLTRAQAADGSDLAALLRALIDLVAPPPSLPNPSALESPENPVLAQWLDAIPTHERASLTQALGQAPDIAPRTLAELLVGFLKQRIPSDEAPSALPHHVRMQLAKLLGRPLSPQEPGVQVLLRALERSVYPSETPVAPPQLPEGPRPPLAERLAQVLAGTPATPPELPEVWEAWLPTALRALSDPTVSPREAPFHILQAREGTAFFEIPLPWAPGQSCHLWVEDPPEGEERAPKPIVKRALLGLRLSNLGEVRIGFAWTPQALIVRLWIEHPEPMATALDALRRELTTEHRSVDLKLLPLPVGPEGTPSLQAFVTGRHLEALG